MRPYCNCEYCSQDRQRRALEEMGEPEAVAEPVEHGTRLVLELSVAIGLPVLAIIGVLVAWWVQ